MSRKTFTLMATSTALLLMAVLFVVIPSVYGEQTVKSIEVPIGYVAQSTANHDYITTITIKPPDGISQIISFEIILKGDFQASTVVWSRVRKTGTSQIFSCSPSSWTIPNVDVPNYEVTFDCSDLASHYNFTTGQIDAGFQTSKMAQNLKGYVRMTYYNDPTATIKMHGTEYNTGDNGLIFLQLLDNDNHPINDSTCWSSIYSPDSSVWKYQQLMSYADEGLYYYPFDVPYMSGVYMVSALCTLPSINVTLKEVWDDFETGNGSGGEGWSDDWTLGGAVVGDARSYNGNYSLVVNRDDNAYRIFNGSSDDESIDVSFWYWMNDNGFDSDDYFNAYLIDSDGVAYLLDSWGDGDGDNLWYHFTESIYRDVDNFNLTGNITLKFNTSGNPDSGRIFIDVIDISLNGEIDINTSQYQIVRGSGEVHVNSENGYPIVVLQEFYNFSDYYFDGSPYEYKEGLMFYNITVISQTIADELDVEFGFNNPYKVGCNALEEFEKWNGTDWVDATDEIIEQTASGTESCIYTIEATINRSETLYYRISLDNYMKWEIEWIHDLLNDTNNTIYSSCQYIAQANNYTYEIPITTSTNMSNVSEVRHCHRLFDDIYWAFDDYNEYIADPSLQNLEASLQDMSFYRTSVQEQYDWLAGFLQSIDILQLPQYKEITSSYTIISMIASLSNLTAEEVWNYGERNLTFYNLTEVLNILRDINGTVIQINTTLTDVNNTVWQIRAFQLNELSNNFTEIQLLLENINQTASNTCKWLVGMTNLSAKDVWNYGERNLTFYNLTGVLGYLHEINKTIWNITIGNLSVQADVNWTDGVVKFNNFTDPVVVTANIMGYTAYSSPEVESTYSVCIDNTTLLHTFNTTKCFLGNCFPIESNTTEVCTYGCHVDRCNPAPFDRTLFIFLVMVGIFLFLTAIVLVYDRFSK